MNWTATVKRRLMITVVASAVAGAGAVAVVAWTDDDKMTPCQAATKIVTSLQGKDPAVIAYAESHGVGFSGVLRGLITGYPDVKGTPSEEVAGHLRTVADDLGQLAGAPPGELTTGKTGQDIAALLAECRT